LIKEHNMTFLHHSRRLHASILAVVCASAASMAIAQGPYKSVITEPVPAFQSFQRWVSSRTVVVPPVASSVVRVAPVRMRVAGAAAPSSYQPQAVIMGLPDLPLKGLSGQQAWGSNANYQGVHVRLWVLDAKGHRREARTLAQALKGGERFKVQITTTFDAVASVDQVLGDAWYGQRTGQVYPQPGMSVAMKAGESISLPLGEDEYFLMNQPTNERLVLAVRHPKAVGGARSNQPAYRQDIEGGTGLLQMVPPGNYPSVEHLISQRP
jgi:hypothetical protein